MKRARALIDLIASARAFPYDVGAMTVTEAKMEPSLFDLRSREAEPQQPHSTSVPSTNLASQAEAANDALAASIAHEAAELAETAESPEPTVEKAEDKRKRIEKQLDALKRKEAELRRALLVTGHPEIGDVIGAIEGRVFAVTRAEEKAGHGLSKAELRRRETIDKKLASLREKRVELDSQIGALEQELAGLGSEQLAAFEAERRQALTQLLVTISTHASALSAVGLDANSLVPDRLLSEIEAIAREVSAQS